MRPGSQLLQAIQIATAMYATHQTPVLKADKGKRNGSCNRTACQQPGAFWYNRVMDSYYCTECAFLLNKDNLPNGERLCVVDKAAANEHFGSVGKSPEEASAYVEKLIEKRSNGKFV